MYCLMFFKVLRIGYYAGVILLPFMIQGLRLFRFFINSILSFSYSMMWQSFWNKSFGKSFFHMAFFKKVENCGNHVL